MRVVLFGTPAYAVPTLRLLAADPRFELTLVVTQPDRPAGRGRRLEPPPVAIMARELGLRVYQPPSLRDAAARAPLAAAAADLFVVAAYGLIFGPKTLALPRLGCLNLHASLLPRYRGASPVAAAILAGDAVTGVTLMRMERGLDTGPLIATAEEAIRADDTTATLTDRLGELGATLAGQTLPRFAAGEIVPMPQPDVGASLTRPLTKADGWLDWTRPAAELERRVRAMWPWPRAWTTYGHEVIQVHASAVVPDVSGEPGRIIAGAGATSLTVACGRDALRLAVVQPPGGRPMPDRAFLAGRRAPVERLGRHSAPAPAPALIVAL